MGDERIGRRGSLSPAEEIAQAAQAEVARGLVNRDGVKIDPTEEADPDWLTKSQRRPKLGTAQRPHGHKVFKRTY
jgi:hypothetical protein